MFVIGRTIQKLHTLVRISIGIVVYTISFFSIMPTFALYTLSPTRSAPTFINVSLARFTIKECGCTMQDFTPQHFASKKEFVCESRISGYLAKLPSICLHFTSRVAVNIITWENCLREFICLCAHAQALGLGHNCMFPIAVFVLKPHCKAKSLAMPLTTYGWSCRVIV